jgi:hypothetical protein
MHSVHHLLETLVHLVSDYTLAVSATNLIYPDSRSMETSAIPANLANQFKFKAAPGDGYEGTLVRVLHIGSLVGIRSYGVESFRELQNGDLQSDNHPT